MNIIFNPNIGQLDIIQKWLKTERDENSQGFYCNWTIIENSFSKGKIIMLEDNLMIVGFLIWSDYKDYLQIDIFEIHPECRKKGIGEYFYSQIEEHFRSQKFIAIKLFCEPEESEGFWKKVGFLKFPIRGYSESELTYYKPLLNVCQPSEFEKGDRLELWNVEPHQVKNTPPNWTWKIKENMDPILQPANGDWNLKLTRNNIVVKEDKVKYFSDGKEILIGPFLFIKMVEMGVYAIFTYKIQK